MQELALSVGEPFTSPAFNANFVVFAGELGNVIAQENSEEYLRKVCRYAKHYGVYLVPERFVLLGYHCLCLISPLGEVIGAQKAAFLNSAQKAAPKRSTSLEVFSTEFGSIFLCVDVDIYRPEVTRIACNMGAQIIISVQQINRGDYAGNMVVLGGWNAAQQNGVYVIGVSNQFNCVCAPITLTTHQDGFVVPPNLKLPLTAKLNAGLLRDLPRRLPLNRKLLAVHREDLLI